MLNDGLKPCPFCGGRAIINEKTKSPECTKCLATIPSSGGVLRKYFDRCGYRQYMIGLWNRRAENG